MPLLLCDQGMCFQLFFPHGDRFELNYPASFHLALHSADNEAFVRLGTGDTREPGQAKQIDLSTEHTETLARYSIQTS